MNNKNMTTNRYDNNYIYIQNTNSINTYRVVQLKPHIIVKKKTKINLNTIQMIHLF